MIFNSQLRRQTSSCNSTVNLVVKSHIDSLVVDLRHISGGTLSHFNGAVIVKAIGRLEKRLLRGQNTSFRLGIHGHDSNIHFIVESKLFLPQLGAIVGRHVGLVKKMKGGNKTTHTHTKVNHDATTLELTTDGNVAINLAQNKVRMLQNMRIHHIGRCRSRCYTVQPVRSGQDTKLVLCRWSILLGEVGFRHTIRRCLGDVNIRDRTLGGFTVRLILSQ